jgi:hypothetical protein
MAGGLTSRSLVRFLVRAIMAVLVAFVIARFFFQGISLSKTFLLGAILFALAYLFEFARRHD